MSIGRSRKAAHKCRTAALIELAAQFAEHPIDTNYDYVPESVCARNHRGAGVMGFGEEPKTV